MLHQGFRINDPSVIFQLFDDEVVAIHLASGTYHSLQGIAGEAFQLLGVDGATSADVAAELARTYDAPAGQIERDLDPFFAKLEAEQLIAPATVALRPMPEPGPARSRAPYLAPDFQTHRDLQQLFLIDPVHDVDATGWPNLPAAGTETASAMECRLAGPHVISEKLEDETVVIHTGSGAYHSLRGPAEDAFLLMEHQPLVEEIATALTGKYDAPRGTIENALRDFVSELASAGLVTTQSAPPGRLPKRLEARAPGTNVAFGPMRIESFRDSGGASSGLETAGPGRFRLCPGELVSGRVDGECVVAERQDGGYFRLNQAASDVLELLRKHPSNPREIAAALSGKYEASERDLLTGVIILLRNLVHANLVTFDPAEVGGPVAQPAIEVPPVKQPFRGFECTMHKDLRPLLSPLNAGRPRRGRAPRPGTGEWLLGGLSEFFAEAAERTEEVHFTLAMADSTVRVMADQHSLLADLTRACAHLESRNVGRPDLTIHAWDNSTPFSDPLVASSIDRLFVDWPFHCGADGQILGLDGDRVAAFFHPASAAISILDRPTGQAFFLKRDRTPLPNSVAAAPFRAIFHAWFGSRGGQLVHGAAAGTSEGGVLLAGKDGSGRSTTAMVCAAAGMQIAGDDFCLANPATAHLCSAYNTVRLRPDADRTGFPAIAVQPLPADRFEKGSAAMETYFLREMSARYVTSGFPLRAILIPNFTGGDETRLEPCSPADALLALLPGTIAQLPGADQQDGDRLTKLAASLPAFRLHLGRDRAGIAAAVRRAAS